jgi:hypothetical protein
MLVGQNQDIDMIRVLVQFSQIVEKQMAITAGIEEDGFVQSLNQAREAVRSFYKGVYGDIVIGHGELDFLGSHDFLLSVFRDNLITICFFKSELS